MSSHICFIGGGNMASALIGGLIKQGVSVANLNVIEPFEAARTHLLRDFSIAAHPNAEQAAQAGNILYRPASENLIVWAVKPQNLKEATHAVKPHAKDALHLSVAAGIRSDTLATWLGSERVVRAMPNTPALIGQGITGLFARPAVTANDKDWITRVIASTGEFLWLDDEALIDAVTALSGSGPAYVFYFLEAMREAGAAMGLPSDQAYQLAIATFRGASALAHASNEAPEVLRQRVTSKGGTTYAALNAMESAHIKPAFIAAMQAAHTRAQSMAKEWGEPL